MNPLKFTKKFANKNTNTLDKFLKIYKPGNNLTKPDKEILDFGRQVLPQEIIDLWTNYGFGDYGDGLIKVIDPRDYMNSLYTWLGAVDYSKVPIILTAFGDIFYYRKLNNNEDDICMLNIHYRKVDVCTYSFNDFINNYIIDDNVKNEVLRENLYSQAIHKFGKLEPNNIFFFVPALVLGGAEDIKYIDKGSASVHHQILFNINE